MCEDCGCDAGEPKAGRRDKVVRYETHDHTHVHADGTVHRHTHDHSPDPSPGHAHNHRHDQPALKPVSGKGVAGGDGHPSDRRD